jgi:hypothetical protein
MKKLLFLFLCCSLSTFCKAQFIVNGSELTSEVANLDTMKIMYVNVILTDNGKNYLGILDAGDGIQWALYHEVSKKIRGFKSPAHLFNFMHNNQWEYVDAIENVSSTGAFGQIMFGVNVTKTKLVYVFKRRKS